MFLSRRGKKKELENSLQRNEKGAARAVAMLNRSQGTHHGRPQFPENKMKEAGAVRRPARQGTTARPEADGPALSFRNKRIASDFNLLQKRANGVLGAPRPKSPGMAG